MFGHSNQMFFNGNPSRQNQINIVNTGQNNVIGMQNFVNGPFAGSIGGMYVEPGTFVNTGTYVGPGTYVNMGTHVGPGTFVNAGQTFIKEHSSKDEFKIVS